MLGLPWGLLGLAGLVVGLDAGLGLPLGLPLDPLCSSWLTCSNCPSAASSSAERSSEPPWRRLRLRLLLLLLLLLPDSAFKTSLLSQDSTLIKLATIIINIFKC